MNNETFNCIAPDVVLGKNVKLPKYIDLDKQGLRGCGQAAGRKKQKEIAGIY